MPSTLIKPRCSFDPSLERQSQLSLSHLILLPEVLSLGYQAPPSPFFTRVCQVSTIMLVHVPGDSGTWQNEIVGKLAKQALFSSDSVDLKTDIC